MPDASAAVPTGSALTEDALLRAINAAPDGVLVVDEAGTIVFANPMVEVLFEYASDELVGMCVDRLLPEDTSPLHTRHREIYVADPQARNIGSGLDLRARKRSGAEFPVEISLSPLEGRGRLLVIAIVRDVTDRRDVELAVERARAALALVDERERIARDLHDSVVQRLFAVGLSLQGLLTRVGPGPEADRIEQAIDDIDHAIREVRSTIFAFHSRRPGGASLRDEVLRIVGDTTRVLGFAPAIAFDGPIDSAATENMSDELIATLREALSNVARHGQATSVNIEVAIKRRRLVLRVGDDGIGLTHPTSVGGGLGNMRARAEGLNGECEVTSPGGRGTIVTWWVPLDDFDN